MLSATAGLLGAAAQHQAGQLLPALQAAARQFSSKQPITGVQDVYGLSNNWTALQAHWVPQPSDLGLPTQQHTQCNARATWTYTCTPGLQ